MLYPPLIITFILFFIFFALLIFVFVQIGIISYAFNKIGVAPNIMFSLIFFSIFGSFINIPIFKLAQPIEPAEERVIYYYGFRYYVPRVRWQEYTVVAVNLGGAVVPTTLSIYLLTVTQQFWPAVLGVFFITVVIKRISRVIPGLGIAVPTFMPPLLAALYGLIFAPQNAPAVAYIAGTLGTLIGADILNLPKIAKIKAPIVSIGGAGTFDGIFLTGIIAVLLASI